MKFTKAEVDALIVASPRTTVPFNKLVLSANHQSRPAGKARQMSIAELAASIKANDLLHNLVVVRGARGQFEVCAGGRRLQALALLVANGDFAENHPVPVMVVADDKALLASLIENVQREALHPADELAAFTRLIAEGKSVEDVAAAFGVTPLVVKRRLKLATVSPQLVAQFRAGEIGMDCLMVLASVDDHKRQEETWARLPQWNRDADHLRRLMTQGEIESDRDPVARFVTLKAYEKAGGALRRDLFCDDDRKAYLMDAALLEQLAVDKLARAAKQAADEGWKWVEVRARYVFEEFAKCGELRRVRRQPTTNEAADIADIEGRLAELHARMEAMSDGEADGDEDEFARLETEDEALQARLQALQDVLCTWPAELMAQAGCVVHVGRDGSAEVKRGLIRPEDRASMAEAAKQPGESASTGPSPVSLPAASTRPVHSEKLMRRLTAHRVAAVQAELLHRPEVALAALTAHLAVKLLKDGWRCHRGGADALTVNATDVHDGLRRESEDMADSLAWKQVDAERLHWTARLPNDAAAVFPWLLTQEPNTVARLFTFLVAGTVTGVCGVERETQSTDALAAALGLDMRKWWVATVGSYFEHVSKGRVLEVVTEAAGANAASPLASLKKDAVVAGAEQAMAGSGWLPAVLRTPSAKVSEAGDATGDCATTPESDPAASES